MRAMKSLHRRCRLGPERAARGERGIPERDAGVLGLRAQHLEALRADAARRQVHDALEGGIVAPIGDQAQIGERILDLRALKEAQAAVHAVRQARAQQRLFQHPRLGVRAIQDRHVAARAAAVAPLADPLHDEVRLIALVEGGVQADLFAARAVRPEVLAEPAGVVRDERVRRLEDGARGAVVLLEAVELRVGEVAPELLHVLHARAAPAIDRLIIVKYGKRAARAAHQQAHPGVLDGVRVLELIHQHVAEAPPVVREQLAAGRARSQRRAAAAPRNRRRRLARRRSRTGRRA